ncbi:OTU-like cysteine protease [Musa troglodytarum]|uniref:OTU-like cysteine protease n=1 Tax=Musa troglodytarum TaxID=320322 RepID=A0A9E7K5L1_9LILI|nr:OTU-like cysteine protease [Musa troglodytarum]
MRTCAGPTARGDGSTLDDPYRHARKPSLEKARLPSIASFPVPQKAASGAGASLASAFILPRLFPSPLFPTNIIVVFRTEIDRGIPGDGRCLFRSVMHGACLRAGKLPPDEKLQRELADELRARIVASVQWADGLAAWGNLSPDVPALCWDTSPTLHAERNIKAWGRTCITDDPHM